MEVVKHSQKDCQEGKEPLLFEKGFKWKERSRNSMPLLIQAAYSQEIRHSQLIVVLPLRGSVRLSQKESAKLRVLFAFRQAAHGKHLEASTAILDLLAQCPCEDTLF